MDGDAPFGIVVLEVEGVLGVGPGAARNGDEILFAHVFCWRLFCREDGLDFCSTLSYAFSLAFVKLVFHVKHVFHVFSPPLLIFVGFFNIVIYEFHKFVVCLFANGVFTSIDVLKQSLGHGKFYHLLPWCSRIRYACLHLSDLRHLVHIACASMLVHVRWIQSHWSTEFVKNEKKCRHWSTEFVIFGFFRRPRVLVIVATVA